MILRDTKLGPRFECSTQQAMPGRRERRVCDGTNKRRKVLSPGSTLEICNFPRSCSFITSKWFNSLVFQLGKTILWGGGGNGLIIPAVFYFEKKEKHPF